MQKPSLFLAGAVALAATLAAVPASGAAEITPKSSDNTMGRKFHAKITSVPKNYRAQMIGVSWKEGCPVPIEDLRIITMDHYGFDGKIHKRGKLMVHKLVAADVADVFEKLFEDEFPIRRMELIETYEADDDASMAVDNTSAFNCRAITGKPGTYSEHSYGTAIDINPIENPYVKGDLVLPEEGKEFVDRSDVRPGMILEGDIATDEFQDAGFDWGGNWQTLKDYQHFEFID